MYGHVVDLLLIIVFTWMLVEVLLMLFCPKRVAGHAPDAGTNVLGLCGTVFCAFECKLDVQTALCSDVHIVPGRVLLFHLVGFVLTRSPVLPPVGLGHRRLFVDHLSRYGYDVVFDELLADV